MSQLRAGLRLVALLLLVACDIPTGAPIYDTLWEVPGKSTSISVNTILPSGVTVAPDNSAFQVTVTPSSVSINRDARPGLRPVHFTERPVGAEAAVRRRWQRDVSLPSSVTSATLVRDTLTVTLSNGFNFDPIRSERRQSRLARDHGEERLGDDRPRLGRRQHVRRSRRRRTSSARFR